ncbi:TlpA disulfide reductase family protein [Zoogloea sp.]|uniref:TlpA family protein disulfide reductase n=1 Tax=Zoogloea sp. TaxID=49181 RepID=UPI001AD136F5|nr:TlpA disulfide reductase family protein [Zoogloea sp.]MBN8284604.1 TlpA family protein disulfide reductase [Zoogloea sp.]
MTDLFICAMKASLAPVAGLLLYASAHADSSPAAALDFELSDGRQFVRLSKLQPSPSVINFWRADCPPCVSEMPLLAAIAREDKVRVLTVALQRPAETLSAPAAVQSALAPPMIALHGPREPRGLLARFGNSHGALPHTVVLDARRHVCAQRTGEVDESWLRTALSRCIAHAGQP